MSIEQPVTGQKPTTTTTTTTITMTTNMINTPVQGASLVVRSQQGTPDGVAIITDPDTGDILATFDPATGERLLTIDPISILYGSIHPLTEPTKRPEGNFSRDISLHFDHPSRKRSKAKLAGMMAACAVVRDQEELRTTWLRWEGAADKCSGTGSYIRCGPAVRVALAGAAWLALNGFRLTDEDVAVAAGIICESGYPLTLEGSSVPVIMPEAATLAVALSEVMVTLKARPTLMHSIIWCLGGTMPLKPEIIEGLLTADRQASGRPRNAPVAFPHYTFSAF